MSGPKKQVSLKKDSIVLAFDFGTKNIGVAVGQLITQTATPLKAVPAKKGTPDWQQIAKIVNDWKPDLLLVGVPLHMDGKRSEMSDRAEKFSRRLSERLSLPCVTMDERLSSFEAEQLVSNKDSRLSGGKRRDKKEDIDSLSACLILESWFNQENFESS